MTTIESGIAYVHSFDKHRNRLRESWKSQHPEWMDLEHEAFAQAVHDESDRCAKMDVEIASRKPRGF